MNGPRLAGLLTGVAIGTLILGCLFTWVITWAIGQRRQKLARDLEATKAVLRSGRHYTLELLEDPPRDHDAFLAMQHLRMYMRNISGHCSDKCSISSPPISDSRLQSYLTELSGGDYRLSSQSLLELVPSWKRAFVSHVVTTTLIGAITDHAKSPMTILHSALSPALTATRPTQDPEDQEDRRRVLALIRNCVNTVHVVESNEEEIDRLKKVLTNLIGEVFGSAVIDDKDFQGYLRSAFNAAIKLGSILLHHPAEFRFDWTADAPASEKPVTMFPWLYRVTDMTGVVETQPLLIDSGAVALTAAGKALYVDL
ncbi:MAG: hypothetical protein Q9187_005430 [Circinaria calcarea]